MKILLFAAVLLLAGCTDAERASYGSYGDRSDVQCWSGGQAVFTDVSTGKVMVLNSGGLTYKSYQTGKYVKVFADCVVQEQWSINQGGVK